MEGPESEVEKWAHANLSAPTMVLLSFLPAMMFFLSMMSLDVYDLFQIFLHETGSQEISALVCRLVFSGVELSCYAARILFELRSTAAGLPRKPVSSLPP